ncbi:MAG TPA: general stress protein [Candidatus Dojkabacteria bacterium]|nr:general stress protein [Candidatus Dojkabacteria bacterium]HRO65417.1 general stress protein [Candidatus Dojkabacteria bacterium]HRP37491.1 general stress protein [Candidatus Dojkabacteria bacterium]HRP50699.1 general stress protein [Candidatus Dojkabacteria bacterium]
MANTIFGIFAERESAEEAINSLKSQGYDPKDISIVVKDRSEGERIAEETGSDVAEGAVAGATSGAILGGLAGLLASFVLPGIGALFVGGPIAAALGLTGAAATVTSGVATGALAGGLIGALTGLGLPEEDARVYEERIKEGGILVAVSAHSSEEVLVENIFSENHAEDVKSVSV